MILIHEDTRASWYELDKKLKGRNFESEVVVRLKSSGDIYLKFLQPPFPTNFPWWLRKLAKMPFIVSAIEIWRAMCSIPILKCLSFQIQRRKHRRKKDTIHHKRYKFIFSVKIVFLLDFFKISTKKSKETKVIELDSQRQWVDFPVQIL